MKVNEVIRLLQAADPTGECEVCVGNIDIHFIALEPAYYDGPLQLILRDPGRRGYNVVGARYKRQGDKVQIHLLPIKTALTEDPDMPVDYGELDPERAEATRANHDRWCAEVKELTLQLSRDRFVRWFFDEVASKGWCSLDPECGESLHEYAQMLVEDAYGGEWDIDAHYEVVLGCDGCVAVQKKGK